MSGLIAILKFLIKHKPYSLEFTAKTKINGLKNGYITRELTGEYELDIIAKRR